MRSHFFFSLSFSAATAAIEGKMGKGLKKVLKKVIASDVQEQLAVADAKLGSAIKASLSEQQPHTQTVATSYPDSYNCAHKPCP